MFAPGGRDGVFAEISQPKEGVLAQICGLHKAGMIEMCRGLFSFVSARFVGRGLGNCNGVAKFGFEQMI